MNWRDAVPFYDAVLEKDPENLVAIVASHLAHHAFVEPGTRRAVSLLAGALLTLVPLGLTGHSSAGGAHDLATNSLLIHLVAGALWAVAPGLAFGLGAALSVVAMVVFMAVKPAAVLPR